MIRKTEKPGSIEATTAANRAAATGKIPFKGLLVSIQPRIRLTRSFDQRTHSYQGWVLRVQGTIGAEQREFLVAIGAGTQTKHSLHTGYRVSGEGVLVTDRRMETAEYYKVSKLKTLERGSDAAGTRPPWQGMPPPLAVYRERGHRRLDARTYQSKCTTCIWGCRMPVEMIIDQWNPSEKRYRQETFCYGPLSCRIYRAGPTRRVPGRRGMSYEEGDWVDEDAVGHRELDD